ncbi:MAG: hypothetical protein D3910_18975 [Candidatus Electrothrix sp. ATG2]|nr:hypothetical protein [Candidatus Electrothrix sp. ATG2]
MLKLNAGRVLACCFLFMLPDVLGKGKGIQVERATGWSLRSLLRAGTQISVILYRISNKECSVAGSLCPGVSPAWLYIALSGHCPEGALSIQLRVTS